MTIAQVKAARRRMTNDPRARGKTAKARAVATVAKAKAKKGQS